MDITKIMDKVYLFNSYMNFMDLNFSQYLLDGDMPVLIHTGSRDQTEIILPEIKRILGEKSLEYVFVSHFESDECGGLGLIMENYPQIKTICSQVTARQLREFGITDSALAKNNGETLKAGGYEFEFITYPSEIHLWDGLMIFETNQGLLFSSDIFAKMGKLEEPVITSDLMSEVRKIQLEKVPSPEAHIAMQESILKLPVKYILPGHGPCIKV